MNKEIAKKEELASPGAIAELMKKSGTGKYATETALTTVTKVGDWLPYLVLHGSNSQHVKKGEIGMGHFGLHPSKGQIIDCGAEVVIFAIAWRPKAMQYKPKVLSFFDSESKEFKQIEEKAKTQKNSGCGVGPEFLVWLPQQGKFATYFLGNKTGRNESSNIMGPLQDKGPFKCVQKAKLIESGEYAWHGPQTMKHDLDIKMPPMDKLAAELEKFNNPPAAAEEAAEEGDGDEARR